MEPAAGFMGGCYSERRLWCVWLSGEPCVPVARARLVLHGRAQAENVEGHHPRTHLKWQDLGHFNDFFSMNPFLTATSYWPTRFVHLSLLARPGFRGTSAQAWPRLQRRGQEGWRQGPVHLQALVAWLTDFNLLFLQILTSQVTASSLSPWIISDVRRGSVIKNFSVENAF